MEEVGENQQKHLRSTRIDDKQCPRLWETDRDMNMKEVEGKRPKETANDIQHLSFEEKKERKEGI